MKNENSFYAALTSMGDQDKMILDPYNVNTISRIQVMQINIS